MKPLAFKATPILTLILSQYHGMSEKYETGLETVNAILVAVFTVDIILKLAAYGVKQYFLGGSWNIFDFIVLVGSFIDIMVSTWYTVSKFMPFSLSFLRSFVVNFGVSSSCDKPLGSSVGQGLVS